ncbi:MAG: hypothetical protein ACI4UE_04270 [Candidatus Scatovivens sp.]
MAKYGHIFLALMVVGLISFFSISAKPTVASGTVTIETEAKTTIMETTEKQTEALVTEPKTTKETIAQTSNNRKIVTTTKKVVESTTTTKKAVREKNYTDSDVYLLAQILFCEAGGCGNSEMAKVGQVVLNRKNTDYWEFKDCDTIYDVVSQKNSYPQTLKKIKNGIVPSEAAKQVAKGLLDGSIDSGLSKDVLWQTGFKPSWNVIVVQKTEWHYYSALA